MKEQDECERLANKKFTPWANRWGKKHPTVSAGMYESFYAGFRACWQHVEAARREAWPDTVRELTAWGRSRLVVALSVAAAEAEEIELPLTDGHGVALGDILDEIANAIAREAKP